MPGSYVAWRPSGKKMALVQCAASAAKTAGVFFGQGPSSKVSTISPSRRKSCALKCSKPKPGPPVVSIPTTRETPSASGLPGHDVATCGTGAGAGAGAAGVAAGVGACAFTDWGASATRGGALYIVVTAPRGASSTVVTTVRTCVSLERACPGEDEAIVTDDRCERTAPMIATSRTIASAHAIAPNGRTISEAAGRINGTYGEADWTPIRYVNRSYSQRALAGLYRSARVGLVTPLRDGMNLVAQDYIAAQNPEDPGVLILSRFAGAASECTAALLVNPYDPEAVATSIAQGLSMPLEERRTRHQALFQVISDNDLKSWGEHFLAALT